MSLENILIEKNEKNEFVAKAVEAIDSPVDFSTCLACYEAQSKFSSIVCGCLLSESLKPIVIPLIHLDISQPKPDSELLNELARPLLLHLKVLLEGQNLIEAHSLVNFLILR